MPFRSLMTQMILRLTKEVTMEIYFRLLDSAYQEYLGKWKILMGSCENEVAEELTVGEEHDF